MKFAKVIFWIAGVWGVLILTPLYFMFDLIGLQDPPAITHPGFFYGFIGVGLAWQIAFFFIATDPVRYRPIMIPSIIEKLSYGVAMTLLFSQSRIKRADLAFAWVDVLFALLFAIAFFKVGRRESLRSV
jgi:hypothetical protein